MKKILVVEDDDLSRDMLSRRLQKHKYDVIIAVDGYNALLLALEKIPDIILMDLSLPDINGLEVIKQIRNTHGITNIPIIILTGHTQPNNRKLGIAVGADEFETKPIHFERLISKIEYFVNRKNY